MGNIIATLPVRRIPGGRMRVSLSRRPAMLRFGEFQLDEAARELRRGGAPVPLQDQPFRVLTVLLASAGEVVTREQLRQDLWPDDVFVDFEHGLNTAVRRLREVLGDTADHPRFIETLPRRGYRFIAPVERMGREGRSQRIAVAVLPFRNLSPNQENAYFTDGITEDLITELAHVPALRVVSRTSAMRFRDPDRNVREVARALRVDLIVEGSVREAGNRVRITARLIDPGTDEQLWADDFDRLAADVLSTQKEIAVQVATALAPGLSADQTAAIGSIGTMDVDAYHLYLRGRHCLFQFTEQGLRQGIEYCERACVRDASYALPHAAIAFAYMVLGIGHGAGTMPQKDARARVLLSIGRSLSTLSSDRRTASTRASSSWWTSTGTAPTARSGAPSSSAPKARRRTTRTGSSCHRSDGSTKRCSHNATPTIWIPLPQ